MSTASNGHEGPTDSDWAGLSQWDRWVAGAGVSLLALGTIALLVLPTVVGLTLLALLLPGSLTVDGWPTLLLAAGICLVATFVLDFLSELLRAALGLRRASSPAAYYVLAYVSALIAYTAALDLAPGVYLASLLPPVLLAALSVGADIVSDQVSSRRRAAGPRVPDDRAG